MTEHTSRYQSGSLQAEWSDSADSLLENASLEIRHIRRPLPTTTNRDTIFQTIFSDEPELYTRFDRARQRHIVDFAIENNFFIDLYTIDDKKLLVLDDGKGTRIPDDRVIRYKEEQSLHQGEMLSSCFLIAKAAIENGSTHYAIYTRDVREDFITYFDHAINYDILSDGSAIGIDFTAIANLDSNTGNFDSFAIKAKNKAQLMNAVEKLYGGTWQDIEPSLYKAIPTSEQ